jgi:hypothetical protein
MTLAEMELGKDVVNCGGLDCAPRVAIVAAYSNKNVDTSSHCGHKSS